MCGRCPDRCVRTDTVFFFFPLTFSYNFFFTFFLLFLSSFKTRGFLSSIITPDAAFVLPRRQKLHRSLL